MVERELGRTGTAPLQLLNALCELGTMTKIRRGRARLVRPDFDDEGGHAAGNYNPGIILNRCSNWPMMSDPRFVRLCHKLRYIDFWLETGRWPDFADQVPYDLRPRPCGWPAVTSDAPSPTFGSGPSQSPLRVEICRMPTFPGNWTANWRCRP